MKRRTSVLAMAVMIAGLIMPAKMAFADSALPPDQLPVFTALWWEWALSIPAPTNPTLDKTGEDCMIGQRDFVWLLAGVNPSGSATRTCAVPADKTLFFPVINAVNVNTPNCGQGGQNFSVATLRSQIKPLIDGARNLSVTVDGKDKTDLLQRVQSVPFVAAMPQNNTFGPDACKPGVPLPAGIYSPSVDDGYYVALAPLKPGQHTIHFHAERPTGVTQQDVKYVLTVVPVMGVDEEQRR
jgi:hypothetical protein